jgi:hypothetical protein
MNRPSLRIFLRWFDARGRQVGSWAFVLNHLTALALTFYLGDYYEGKTLNLVTTHMNSIPAGN